MVSTLQNPVQHHGDERLLTLREVQELANLSKVTLWRAARRGDLRTIRVGRTVRIRPSDYREFLERHTCAGAA